MLILYKTVSLKLFVGILWNFEFRLIQNIEHMYGVKIEKYNYFKKSVCFNIKMDSQENFYVYHLKVDVIFKRLVPITFFYNDLLKS